MKWLLITFAFIATSAMADHELENRDLAVGQSIYVDQCASCHGATLEGQPNWRVMDENGILPAPPHDRTGHTWHHDNQLLFDYTKLGGKGALAARGVTNFNSGMPAFDDVISDEEIWDILAFIQSTWPKEVKDAQKGRNPIHK
jgi:mono/diheme cytochrome c family protein